MQDPGLDPNLGKLPLSGDPKRQAVSALRGYLYQIWHSVYAWLDLEEDEVLFLEGAEDFDVVGPRQATAVQVKGTSPNVTLRSEAIIDAITHYWQLQRESPQRRIFFKFLTRSRVGVERDQPFGPGMAGLDLWSICLDRPESIVQVGKFLSSITRLPDDLRQFLNSSSPEDILQVLIRPITWETGSRDAGFVVQAIERKLVLHGEKYLVPPSSSSPVINRLLREAFETASSHTSRALDRSLFLRIFEEETSERVPKHELQALMRGNPHEDFFPAIFGPERGVSLDTVPAIHRGLPPIPFIVESREPLVLELRSLLADVRVLVLNGSTGSGKTLLARLVARAEPIPWYWLNLSARQPYQVSVLFRELERLSAEVHEPCGIVLDDIDFSPAAIQQHEELLGVLLHILLSRRCRILITAQNPLPQRLVRGFGLDSRNARTVPYLNEEELVNLAIHLGCAEEQEASSWAKIVLMRTKGHPQLAHAHLFDLAQRQWPAVKSEDLLVAPVPVIKERSQARELIANRLLTPA